MATRKENLTTALDNIAQQIADITENPKPDYSIDGQSVSWSAHLANLMTQSEALEKALQRADGAFEVRSRAIT